MYKLKNNNVELNTKIMMVRIIFKMLFLKLKLLTTKSFSVSLKIDDNYEQLRIVET